jgi:hypothetical protein
MRSPKLRVRLGRTAPAARAGRYGIAFLESDRPDGPRAGDAYGDVGGVRIPLCHAGAGRVQSPWIRARQAGPRRRTQPLHRRRAGLSRRHLSPAFQRSAGQSRSVTDAFAVPSAWPLLSDGSGLKAERLVAASAAKGRSCWRSGDGCFSPRPGCRAGSQLAVRSASATRQTSAALQSQVRSSPRAGPAREGVRAPDCLCRVAATAPARRPRRPRQELDLW